jgi:integrase
MAKNAVRVRIYTRTRGGATRYYLDARDYADVGGGREALSPGQGRATADPDEAEVLAGARLKELQELRLRRLHSLPPPTGLAAYAETHLVKKRQAGKVTEQTLAASQVHLERAVAFFGADRQLATVEVEDVAGWIARLRDEGYSSSTIRHHLNSMGNLYRRAQAEKRVPIGYNPVAAYPDKPSDGRREAHWLEVDEAALLLEAARTYRPTCTWFAVPFAYELVATWLLTGGRPSEVTGLEVDDVSLERETVTFRVNAHRRLKTLGSARVVRLWPQLAEILKAYFPKREQMGEGTLLFPSFRTGTEGLLQHPHRILAAVAERIGYQLTPYTLRHTYCAARLQTLDAGAPVSPFTVGRELGHGGDALVRKVYGHLGNVRHRSDVVEYRVEQHAATLRDRLAALRGDS